MTTQNKAQTTVPTIPCEKCGSPITPTWWDMEHPSFTPKWFFQCHTCPDASSFTLTDEQAQDQHAQTF